MSASIVSRESDDSAAAQLLLDHILEEKKRREDRLRSLRDRKRTTPPPVVVVSLENTSDQEREGETRPRPRSRTSFRRDSDRFQTSIVFDDDDRGIMRVKTLDDSINDDNSTVSSGKFTNKMKWKRRMIQRRLSLGDSGGFSSSGISRGSTDATDRDLFSISFGNVSIREYPLIPGDNP